MQDGRYRYKRLDTTEHCIRLLTVLPGTDNDDVCIKLEHVHLGDVKGQYQAVSYTWGSSQPLYKILVGDTYLELQENAYRFLMHARSTTIREQRIWMDAICINQAEEEGNKEEKNAQVSRMGDVYRNAERVLVWLGTTSGDHTFAQKYADFSNLTVAAAAAYLAQPQANNNVWIDYDCYDWIFKDRILRLLFHPYWQRLWIVQELALARISYFVSGPLLIHHGNLSAMRRFCGSEDQYNEWAIRPSIPNEAVDISGYRYWHIDPDMLYAKDYDNPYRQKLAYLLARCGKQSCRDKRDRIYGMLGMTDSAHVPITDYNIGVEELFIRALECLEQDPRFNPVHVSVLAQSLEITCDSFATTLQNAEPSLRARLEQQFRMDLKSPALLTLCPQSIPHAHSMTDNNALVVTANLKRCYQRRYLGRTFATTAQDLTEYQGRTNALIYCLLGDAMCGFIVDRDASNKPKIIYFVIDEMIPWCSDRPRDLPKLHAATLGNHVSQLLNQRLGTDFQRLCTGELKVVPLHFSTLEMLYLGEAAREAAAAGNVKLMGDVH